MDPVNKDGGKRRSFDILDAGSVHVGNASKTIVPCHQISIPNVTGPDVQSGNVTTGPSINPASKAPTGVREDGIGVNRPGEIPAPRP
jgi:hypothetical protein